MGGLRAIFLLVIAFTGIPAFFNRDWSMGLCGTFSPALAIYGGVALAAAFAPLEQRSIGKALTGAILIAVAIAWAAYAGWHFTLWGYAVSGVAENIIGAGLGLTFGITQNSARSRLTPRPEP